MNDVTWRRSGCRNGEQYWCGSIHNAIKCKVNRVVVVGPGASRTHFDFILGGSIEFPEYAIFIKLPEFYWMRFKT